MISQSVRYAEVAASLPPCWESLQFKGWTDNQLSRLQKQWETLDLLQAAVESIALERDRVPLFFDRARKSREDLEGGTGISNPYTGFGDICQHCLVNVREGFTELTDVVGSYPRFWIWSGIWSFDDERLDMQFHQEMMAALRAAQNRKSVLERLTDGEMTEPIFLAFGNVKSRFQISAFEHPALESFVAVALRAQTQVEIVTAAVALERYFLRHQKYPATLSNLVPVLIKRVPVDYMDGKDLRYRLQPDGSYLLYSIGKDKIDHGGDPTPQANMPPGFLNGRDWVWPSVATEQEIKSFEADQARKVEQVHPKQARHSD